MPLVDREMGDEGCLTRKREGLPDVASSQEKAVETHSEGADTDTLARCQHRHLGSVSPDFSRPSSLAGIPSKLGLSRVSREQGRLEFLCWRRLRMSSSWLPDSFGTLNRPPFYIHGTEKRNIVHSLARSTRFVPVPTTCSVAPGRRFGTVTSRVPIATFP